MSPEFAIDLHGVDDLFFLRKCWIEFRPGVAKQAVLLSQPLPELCGKVGRERGQEHDQLALGVGEYLGRELAGGNFIFRAVKLVDELHDRRHGGVEMPASLEIVEDALDGLVQLALDGTRLGREGGAGYRFALSTDVGITHNKAVGSAEEAMYTLDAILLPIELAVRRGGKERIDPGGVGAEAGHHVVRRDHVAFILRHLGAVLDHHALRKKAKS